MKRWFPRLAAPRGRAAVRFTAVTAMAVAATLLTAPYSSAESTPYGRILLGGEGGGFTADQYMGRTGAVGATLTYPVKITNYSGVPTQFRVVITAPPAGDASKFQVLSGTNADITTLATTNGYYTAAMTGYGSETLTVKVTLPSSAPAPGDGFFSTYIDLYSTDGTYISQSYLLSSVSPSKGQPLGPGDISVTAKSSTSVTAGNQPAIGSPYDGLISAPDIGTSGGSTTFNVTVTNHSSNTVTDNLDLAYSFADTTQQYESSCQAEPPIVSGSMKANVLASPTSYASFSLAPGKSVAYTVTVKVSNWQSCPSGGVYYTIQSGTWDGSAFQEQNLVYLGTSGTSIF